MPNLSKTQKVLLCLFLGLIFIYSFNQLKESDAFYHLKTGELIWATKSVPHFDVFSYTAFGAPWVTHEWLAELIFYFVQVFTGFWGLITFVALIAVLTYFIVFRLAVKQGANFYVSLTLLFFLAFTSFQFWIPRPQIFSYLAMAILLFSLEGFRHERKDKYLWIIAGTMFFWANTNASFLLGLAVILFYFFAELVKKYFPWFGENNIKGKGLLKFGAAVLAAILICFINPNTYKIFLYILTIRFSVAAMRIEEWKPIYVFLQDPDISFFLAQLIIVDLFLFWRLFFKKGSRDIVWLGIALGVSILPFLSLRHYVFWPIAVLAPLSVGISENAKNFWEKIGWKRLSIFVFGFVLIFAGARFFAFPKSYIKEYPLPSRAVDFIEANNLKGPMFNLYNEGGYLIWRLWPKEKVFIDGRSEVYGPKQVGDFFTIVKNLTGWEKLVDEKYKINYFILAYWPETISNSIKPLISRLVADNWILVYWDDSAVIYVRNSAENAQIIGKYGLKYISPYRDPFRIPQSEAREAAEEISKILAEAPNSLIVRDYANKFMYSHK